VKDGGCIWREAAGFPERVRTRKRGVAAEGDLDRGRKPAQLPTVGAGHEEGGFRQIQFGGDRLHPVRVRRSSQHADGGGIAPEFHRGKRIHHTNGLAHLSDGPEFPPKAQYRSTLALTCRSRLIPSRP
jgi:hypothetical protein